MKFHSHRNEVTVSKGAHFSETCISFRQTEIQSKELKIHELRFKFPYPCGNASSQENWTKLFFFAEVFISFNIQNPTPGQYFSIILLSQCQEQA